MMLRTAQGYFDFNDDIEVERQVKLLEALDETKGDFSYQFELAKTHNNMNLIGHPLPDRSSKRIYNNIEADIISNTGEVLYSGYLRVESIRDTIACSFFSGNSNWLNLLTGSMTDLELDEYDQVQTEANIVSRFSATDGIVFPIIDTGSLINRKYQNLKRDDFVGCMYLKTIVRELFRQSGLKVHGELLSDPLYNKLVLVTNTRSKVEVDKFSVSLGKNNNQTVASLAIEGVDWNLQTNPYFVGEDATITFTNTAYLANVDMIVDIEAGWRSTDDLEGNILLGGSSIGHRGNKNIGTDVNIKLTNVFLTQGNVARLAVVNNTGATVTITGGYFKVTPRYIYKAFGRSAVPLMTKKEFVSDILKIFNVISDYNPFSKTVTLNLFSKIKDKTPTDISDYTTVTEVDFNEFVSSYGKSTTLGYTEGSSEDLRQYNISSFYKYGQGIITIDNDFLEESATLFESALTTPISYINNVFGCSIERVPFIEMEDVDSAEVTSVSDATGTPRFNITDADEIFAVNDLVRIETELFNYNGEYVVDAVTSTYITVRGLVFEDDTTGTITILLPNYINDESSCLMVYTGSQNVDDFSSSRTELYLQDSAYSSAGLAFFNLINNGTQVNTDFTQGLSFGEITDPLFYQRTMIEQYWQNVGPILNDPVKLICEAYLPEKVFKNLSPLIPVYLRTEETTNLYYINRISGYKSSSSPCEIELIKLSGFVLDTGSLPVGGGGDVNNITLESSGDVLIESGNGVIELE